MRSFLILSALVSLFGTTGVRAENYKLDESHTQVGFRIKHLVISTVSGRFNKYSGSFDYDSKTGKVSGLSATIDTASIDTNEPDRDKHLKSKDFFDVEKYPALTFVQKDVTIKNKKPTEIKGDLTIHGVTKLVTLSVTVNGMATDPWGNERLAFEASTKVDRKDFDLKWNKSLDKGGVMIADDVKIVIEGEAILQKPK
ncbi:MAG: YceI family protein [Bdellovibrionales bacterium]